MEFYEFARELCEQRRPAGVGEMTDAPQRFFFCHLQKTAGTTLIRRIRSDFPPGAVYPERPADTRNPDVARVISVERLLEEWERARRRDPGRHRPLPALRDRAAGRRSSRR